MSLEPELPDPPIVGVSTDACLDANAVAAAVALTHATDLVPGHRGGGHTHCENCGTKLEGAYCHRCGQHDFEFHRSFWHVLLEALESFFHFEGKFFRNIVTLLFRPGRLTSEFNAGKRAAQMPPFRLYVFVSLLFFFLFFLGGTTKGTSVRFADPAVMITVDEEPRAPDEKPVASAAEHVAPAPAPTDLSSDTKAESDAASAAKKPIVVTSLPTGGIRIEGTKNSAFLRWLETTLNRLGEREFRAKLVETFVHNIPRLLLFCLPLFALYTKVLFRRSHLVYLQHLVLALHFHAFVYLWILFRDGWVFLAGWASPTLANLIWQACMLWIAIYSVLMLRALFRNGWARTIWKTVALAIGYVLTLGFGFLVTLFLVLAIM